MRASLTCRHPQAPLYFTRITPDSSAINATKCGTKSDFLPLLGMKERPLKSKASE